jgi:hypothetical protein
MEKNFDKLEVGCWYLTRDMVSILKVTHMTGETFCTGDGTDRYAEGTATSIVGHPADLVYKVDLTPVKIKRKIMRVERRGRIVYRAAGGQIGVTTLEFSKPKFLEACLFETFITFVEDTVRETEVEVEEEVKL